MYIGRFVFLKIWINSRVHILDYLISQIFRVFRKVYSEVHIIVGVSNSFISQSIEQSNNQYINIYSQVWFFLFEKLNFILVKIGFVLLMFVAAVSMSYVVYVAASISCRWFCYSVSIFYFYLLMKLSSIRIH